MDIFKIKRNKRKKLLLTAGYSYISLWLMLGVQSSVATIPTSILYFLSAIYYVSIGLVVWWSIDAQTKYKQAIFAIIPLLLYSVLSHLVILMYSGIMQIMTLVVGMLGFYILLLSVNILFVSHEKRIPLQRAALSTLYFIGMVLFIAFGILLIVKGWGIMAFIGQLWFLILLFCISFINLAADRDLLVESIILGLLSLELLGLVLLWPAQPILVVVSYVGWVFILLGIVQHHIEKELSPSRYTEYIILAIILLLAYTFV